MTGLVLALVLAAMPERGEGADGHPEHVGRRLTDARRALKNGIADLAVQIAREALAAGNTNAALAAYAQAGRLAGAGVRVERVRVDHAELLLALDRRPDAVAILRPWLSGADAPRSHLADMARLRLAELLTEAGEPQTALQVLAPLLADPGDVPDIHSGALARAALVETRAGHGEHAVRFAEQAVERAQSGPARLAAMEVAARVLGEVGEAERALAMLREALRLNPRPTEAASLRLDVAAALRRRGMYLLALSEVQATIETQADPGIEARAQRERGDLLARLGRPDEAAVAYQRAFDLAADPAARSAALYLAGMALGDAELHSRAAEVFQRFVAMFPDSDLAARAALLEAENLSAFAPAEAELGFLAVAGRLTADAEGAHALFRAAQLAVARNDAAAAMRRYAAAIAHAASWPELRVAAYLGKGLLHFRTFHFDLALQVFDQAIASAERGPVVDQAHYLRAAALFNLGMESQSLAAAQAFLEQRPDSPWAPDITYWLGRHFFNRQEFARAAELFAHFAEAWPTRPERAGALLWVARARFALKRPTDASEAALRLVREYPRSPLAAEARFLHGEALCESMRFDEAIVVFDELLALHPDSPWTVPALGRKGDALFTLGTDAPARYAESAAAYAAALARPDITFDMQLQASYKIGRCHEKLGRNDLAIEQYYRHVVRRFLEERASGRWLNERARAWFSRGALSAADLFEQQAQWGSAVAVLQHMAREDVPGRQVAAERAQRLRQTHPHADRGP